MNPMTIMKLTAAKNKFVSNLRVQQSDLELLQGIKDLMSKQ